MRFTSSFLAVAAAALVVCASAVAAGNISEIHQEPLGDLDARAGSVAPTAAQTDAVAALGAKATWSRFGSPHTLFKAGGHLATGVAGATAVEGAKSYLDANKALFRLSSVDGLALVSAGKLAGGAGYAVHLRQRFGSLRSLEDGYVTVGLGGAPNAWKVFWVSSTLTPDATLAAQPSLTATAAWLAAAGRLGKAVTFADIASSVKTQGEWSVFAVRGFQQLQRARLGALPTAGGVRPVWETLVYEVERGHTEGYSSLVDAATGDVLVRKNLVHQSHPDAQSFTGTMAATDGACAPDNGPYVVLPTETNVKSIDVAVEAAPVNDIVLQLKKDGAVVASGDTLTNPEAVHYAPAAGVAPGSYTVAVCDYADGTPAEQPATYVGQIAFNEIASGVPANARWKVFPAYPKPPAEAAFPWGLPNDDIRSTWCWDSNINGTPVPGCQFEVKNLASRDPWDVNANTHTSTFTTIGNNAQAAEAWVNPPTVQYGNITPGATNYRPTSLTRDYSYDWSNAWFNSKCDPASFTPRGVDIDAATTNLFAMHNRMHDWAYHLGLTEENWNAQMSNYGATGAEGDPVIGDVQSGAVSGAAPAYGGRDNANMLTLPDGVPPITNMYLWQPLRGAFYAPCVDGDYDQAIIGHEYGHMVENRLIGKGGTRSGHHAGAMGESHGDLMAMEYLNENGFVPVAGENRYAVGAYATGQKQRGIRNFAMNASPLNFSDMGYDITGPQVHADGEIWSATQFDVRRALVAKYGEGTPELQRSCAEGRTPAENCPGNRRWVTLMFDAMLLMPVAPTMLEARDAMLQADVNRFGGANQKEIWGAYARRGMGENASASNTNADTKTDPTPDFASPLEDNATVTFAPVAADEGNAPVANASVYVGKYEARVSPVADTDASTSGAPNLDATATFAPGEYEFVIVAPGYGHTRVTRTLAAGETVTLSTPLSTNWASGSKGAAATGDGARLGELIDDTEATNWEATGGAQGKQVTVDLAGGTRTVAEVRVSALLKPGQNRFTALRRFELWTCAQTDAVSCSDPSKYTKAYSSPEDAFPGTAPRPVSPAMILRSFTLDTPVQATHVRFVVLDNQCTGQTAFQGVQDNDPTNPTDCRTGKEPESELAVLLPPRDRTVVAAELQVFGPAPAPDVVVDDIELTSLGASKYTVAATVVNRGNGAAGASTTSMVLDQSGSVCTLPTPQIAAGATAIVSCTWDARDVKKGTHSLTATADSGAQIAESSETNNTRTETYSLPLR